MKAQVRGPRLLLTAGIVFTLAVGMLAFGRTAYAGETVTPVPLGTAATFAVLAGTPNVTNTDSPTVVTGNLGIHPGAEVTGFPPGIVTGTIYRADPAGVALQAKNDLTTAYLNAEGREPLAPLPCDLEGESLVAGVYTVDGCTMLLTGTLTLNGQDDPDSVWIFQAPSDLVTSSASTVVFINGGSPCNVFWQIDSSATLGSGSSFVGTIMALTSITIANNVTVDGRALAREGTVTLDNDRIGSSACPGLGTQPSAAPSLVSAAPSVHSAAFSPENEAVSPWSLFLVLSGVAALFISFIVTVTRLTARERI